MAEEQIKSIVDDDVTPVNSEAFLETYLTEDILTKHFLRQSAIVKQSLEDRLLVPITVEEISKAFEQSIFAPKKPPRKQENGTCEPNPKLNFYPTFAIPETLATYHIFFQNQKIPLSCKANRARADTKLTLKEGDRIPTFPCLEETNKIFEGLGTEECCNTETQKDNSALIQLKNDNPRLAVLKRNMAISYFAYPAVNMPPKILGCLIDNLVHKRQTNAENYEVAVDDETLAKWLNVKPEDKNYLEHRRKNMLAAIMVSCTLECLERFFTAPHMLKHLEEILHYSFNHGFVKLACKITNLDLSAIISYLGMLHENRLGNSKLHSTLEAENRRDYVRDCIFLVLIMTWQTAMGVWQQCLEEDNLKELQKILLQNKKHLWCLDSEKLIAKELSKIVFPEKLLQTLHNSLPDFINQSQLHIFRSFILERSGILPALNNAFPSDFIPITFKECPPPLWHYTYLLLLANYIMFHSDLACDVTTEGLLECYCRCNLCAPHKTVATNPALLNEINAINTFELQCPVNAETGKSQSFKLTPGIWASAFLKKFVKQDYFPHQIKFYENQKAPCNKEPTACVITQPEILAQLKEIKKARDEFLLKKGHGIYLDPQTGEELNGADSTLNNNVVREENYRVRSREYQRGRRHNVLDRKFSAPTSQEN